VSGSAGREVAEAECFWPLSRVAVLTEARWDGAAVLRADGWTVWSVEELVTGVIDEAGVLKHVHAHS
jgi:hypothetical protein